MTAEEQAEKARSLFQVGAVDEAVDELNKGLAKAVKSDEIMALLDAVPGVHVVDRTASGDVTIFCDTDDWVWVHYSRGHKGVVAAWYRVSDLHNIVVFVAK